MAAQLIVLLRGHLQDVLALEQDFTADAGARREQAHNRHGGDGLTATGFTHQTHGFTRAHREGDVVNNVDVTVLGREGNGQVFNLQHRFLFGGGVNQAVAALELRVAQLV